MPTTAPNAFIFYEEQFETGMYQGLTQKAALFNEAAGGAITLEAGAFKGLKPKYSFFQANPNIIQTRDPQGSGSLTPATIGSAEKEAVKVFWSAPVLFTHQEWEDYGMSNEEGQFLYGQNLGEALILRYTNFGISALLGALLALEAAAANKVVYDITASAKFSFDALNETLGLAGDNRSMITTMTIHSKPMKDLIGLGLSSQVIAFSMGGAGGATIYNGSVPTMNLQPIQTDAAALLVAGTPNKYYTQLLRPGALAVKTGPTRTAGGLVTGTGSTTPENIKYLLTTEGSFQLDVHGMTYSGAAKPNAAALATAGNWTHKTGSSVDPKNGPGFLAYTQ